MLRSRARLVDAFEAERRILAKLDLPPAEDTDRRVLAVLAYLRA